MIIELTLFFLSHMFSFIVSNLTNSTVSTVTGGYMWISGAIASHGYLAIIGLMSLESASLPIPSEVVLPAIGFFVNKGTLNLELALLATLVGTTVGITVDYYIAYRLGKDVVYKHVEAFHIKKEQIEAFDKWFNNNATVTVFIARLLPVVRGLISFPAGFAQMDLKLFYLYSLTGSAIWNFALIEFGSHVFSSGNVPLIIGAVGLMIQLLYVVYKISYDRIHKQNESVEKERNSY